ncbi:MAG: beta-N-acetylglucosaminidase domain-containing protein, partial [bacterium]
CSKKDQVTTSHSTWKSLDPLSIPLADRKNKFDLENLVINPSFESGKVIAFDSTISYNIEGWKILGHHVKWINKDTLNDKNEVFSGLHSMRIHVNQANEVTETMDGILSEYIRVIPGNYLFTYHVKLKNIVSNKSRFGSKIFDAVDTRVLFYDKNKILLPNDIHCPHLDTRINNSFKGYSFSGFSSIPVFGWHKVIGRTYHFPFSEGDIPDETKYIRIYFGLKGTGTLWVDNVDFRYSPWNFSTIEKLKPYIDSTFSKPALIIPTPRKVIEKEKFKYFSRDKNFIPGILVPSNADEMTLSSAKKLKSALEEKMNVNREKKIEVNITDNSSSSNVIFSIGKTPFLDKFSNKIPIKEIKNQKEGYFIKSFNDVDKKIILLHGNEPVGNYYAVITVLQLIDSNSYYHDATIVDYPGMADRSFQFNITDNNDWNYCKFLENYKFNQFYIDIKNYDNLDHLEKSIIGEGFQNISPNILIDLEYFKKYKDDQLVIDDNKYNKLVKIIKNNDVNVVRILSNKNFNMDENYKIHPLPDNHSMKAKLKNIILFQAEFINQLHLSTGIGIQFLPLWYNNEMINMGLNQSVNYYFELFNRISPSTRILWTGHSFNSLTYDHSDIEFFGQYTDNPPVIYDNSLNARASFGYLGGFASYYPGKVRMCSLFEPYNVIFASEDLTSGGFHINYQANSEIDLLKLMTVADFEWNQAHYNPELSIWKTLLSLYGKTASLHLLEFNDKYFALWDMCMRLERNLNINRNIKMAGTYLDELEIAYMGLEDSLLNKKLLYELFLKKEELKENYYTILKGFKNNQ